MPHRVRWTLLGQEERRLDGSYLDGVYLTYSEAAAEASSFPRGYANVWCSEDGTHWRARRSPDADLEVRVWIEDCAQAEVCAAWA